MNISLTLNTEELEILQELLQNQLSELRAEISHTDRMDYRDLLKARKRVLNKVLDTLSEQTIHS